MLDAIGAGIAPRVGDRDWGEIWRDSEELAATKKAITEMKGTRIKAVGDAPKVEEKEYATPLMHQIRTVVRRTNLAFWRSPNYGFTRLFNQVAISLFSGLAFLNLDNSRTSLQYRVFIIFQTTVIPALILAQVEPKHDLSRLIFYRESAAKAYRQFPFALAMVVAEMPYSILCGKSQPACHSTCSPKSSLIHASLPSSRRILPPPLLHPRIPIRPLPRRLPIPHDPGGGALLRHPGPDDRRPHPVLLHLLPPQPLPRHRLCPLLRRHHPQTPDPHLLARLAV